jgi:uncharacterized protein YbbC (DUF1343 family)
MNDHRVRLGLECCLAEASAVLRGAKFGLLMNQASVDGSFRYACDLLAARFPGQLVSLFSPQHGLWCEQQANMIESTHDRYPPLGLPVHSLYSETRCPTPEMLAGLDVLVIDLQDVGTRIYTFIWTMLECLRACADAGVAVVVLDRPNPLGGDIVEGPLFDSGYESFVGNATIPMRHGLTIGELARLFNVEQQIGADLHVVPRDRPGVARTVAEHAAVRDGRRLSGTGAVGRDESFGGPRDDFAVRDCRSALARSMEIG